MTARTLRRWPAMLAALFATACADGLGTGPDATAPRPSAPSFSSAPGTGWDVGDMAPNLSALDVDGATISIGDYLGSFVLLEVGGAWCNPTRFIAPFLPNIDQAIQNDGVPFASVVTLVESNFPGNPSDGALARAWLDTYYGAGSYRPVLHMDGSSAMAAPWYEPIYEHNAIPILYLLGPDGSIVRFSVGALAEAQLLAWVRDGIGDFYGPDIESVNGLDGPVSNATPLVVDGTFSDPDGNTNGGTVDWGDGTGPQPLTVDPAGTFSTQGHLYASAGFYDVRITLTDDDGYSTSETIYGVTVFDPDGGFIAGSGTVMTSGAACGSVDCDTEGPFTPELARFRILAKYVKRDVVPDGSFHFRFESGSFVFESTSYDWLMTNQNGRNAQLKGQGRVNGVTPDAWGFPGGVFRFMLWATDDSPDTFYLVVWLDADEDQWLVYQEQQPLTLESGNIIVTRSR